MLIAKKIAGLQYDVNKKNKNGTKFESVRCAFGCQLHLDLKNGAPDDVAKIK